MLSETAIILAAARDASEKRKDIARLYPGSKQIWVDSGHAIPLEKPEAIFSAIREVLPPKPPSNIPHSTTTS